MFDVIVVRYGEIGLKSETIRRRFEKQLVKNIKYAFRLEGIPIEISRERGRIFIRTSDTNRAVSILKKIFGIVSVSPSVEVPSDMESIKKASLNVMEKFCEGRRSFAIRSTRSGEHDFTSQDVAIEVGREIKENLHLDVNLENPDIELFIEVRENRSYIFLEKIKGPGGLPVGTQGRVMSLVRDKKDILALWYMLKRGCSARLLVWGEGERLDRFLKSWYVENHVEKKHGKIEENLRNCLALVTGETMDDIDFSLDRKYNVPVMRPLIHLREREIMDMIRRVEI